MKLTVMPVEIGALATVTKRSVQGLANLEIRGYVEINPNYSIVKNAQNKNPGDLKRPDVIQNPVETHRIMLVWKTL